MSSVFQVWESLSLEAIKSNASRISAKNLIPSRCKTQCKSPKPDLSFSQIPNPNSLSTLLNCKEQSRRFELTKKYVNSERNAIICILQSNHEIGPRISKKSRALLSRLLIGQNEPRSVAAKDPKKSQNSKLHFSSAAVSKS